MSKRISTVLLSILLLLYLLSFSVSGKKFNASLGKIELHFRQHNPIKVNLEGGQDGEIVVQHKSDSYKHTTAIQGDGNFEFSEAARVARLDIEQAEVSEDGVIHFHTQAKGKINASTSIAMSDNKAILKDASVSVENANPDNSKYVETKLKIDAKKGILDVNVHEKSFTRLSPTEKISEKLDISKLEAFDMAEKYGQNKVLQAIEEAQNGKRNGRSLEINEQSAGGAGAIAKGNRSVSIQELDPGSVYRFYLQGPKYEARIVNSTLNVRLLYPGNGTRIKGVGANITIVGPVNGNNKAKNKIVLLDSLIYNEDGGYYEYPFDKGSWIIEKDKLEPGGYDLYVDVGPRLKTKFGITITQDREVVGGRY